MTRKKLHQSIFIKSLVMQLFLTMIITLLMKSDHLSIHYNSNTDILLPSAETAPVLNQPPTVVNDVRNKFATSGDTFDVYLPEPVFTDPDEDTLFVSANLSNGDPLPDWINFMDSGTGTGYFSGVAPDEGSLDITVTAADPDGLEASSTFQLNIVESGLCDDFFIVTEEMPQLIGGLKSLQEQARYTADALTAESQGRVYVQFIVGLDGNPYNPQVIRGIHSTLDEEALRVIHFANFIPGYQEGEAACVQYSLPITFRIFDDTYSESLILHPMDDQMLVAGESFQFTVPDSTFEDPHFELGVLQAYSKGYGELPSWLTFSSNSKGDGVFTGTAPGPDTLTIELKPENLDAYHPFQIFIQEQVDVSIDQAGHDQPGNISLHQNYPNPFNPVTTISFQLSEPGNVELIVHDSAGRLVENLVSGYLSAGTHSVPFDGSRLSSGFYHYSLRINDKLYTRSMTLIK